MVRDRADRSSWSNHQFCNGDTVGKNLLPLLAILIGPEGKIFLDRSVDRWPLMILQYVLIAGICVASC